MADAASGPALIISLVSLVVSVATGAHGILSKSRESIYKAQNDFDESVESLIDLRQTREELIKQAGTEWGKNSYTGLRIAINDKRQLVLAKARHILSRYEVSASSMAFTMIAATLADFGRHGESLPYYRKAIEFATTKIEIASGRRVYGRILILLGKLEEGRASMLKAFSDFKELEHDGGMDADLMRSEQADVYRRMIWAEVVNGNFLHQAREDLPILSQMISAIDNRQRRDQMIEAYNELDAILHPQTTAAINAAS